MRKTPLVPCEARLVNVRYRKISSTFPATIPKERLYLSTAVDKNVDNLMHLWKKFLHILIAGKDFFHGADTAAGCLGADPHQDEGNARRVSLQVVQIGQAYLPDRHGTCPQRAERPRQGLDHQPLPHDHRGCGQRRARQQAQGGLPGPALRSRQAGKRRRQRQRHERGKRSSRPQQPQEGRPQSGDALPGAAARTRRQRRHAHRRARRPLVAEPEVHLRDLRDRQLEPL